MSELLKKYESLDQSKLNEGTIKILNRVKTITADFTADDAKNNKIAEDVLNEVMKKNPNAVKIVKRTPKAKTAPKKTHKATHTTKGAHTTSSTAKTSNNIMSVTKEIQKAGESWKDAMERAKAVIKERKEKVVQKQKTELEKLYALVKTKKELIGFSKSDIERDAVRTAKRTGARVVTKEGTTSNGYGTFPNKLGRKYWETRDRHADRLAPNYPKDTPLLASGGAVNDAPFEVFVFKSKLRFDNELPSSSKGDFPTFAKAKEFAIDMIDSGNYYATIENKRGNLWGVDSKGVEQFANGGMMDNMSIHNSTDFFNTPVYANGGEVKSVVDALFEFNEKRGKLNTSFGAKTKEGITALIENDNYSSEEIAKAIFYSNNKKEKISTGYGDKSFFGLQDMIERARGKEFANGGSVNMDKHIWEGWTVGDFIEELEPTFNQIMRGSSWQKPFKTKDEVKAWCMDNQPYYKKNIPDVVNYFWAKAQSKDNYADGGEIKKLETSLLNAEKKYRKAILSEQVGIISPEELKREKTKLEDVRAKVNEWYATKPIGKKMADGGMFEEPIGMMREVKGKTVNVPVTDEISQSEVNRFVDYVYEAYESYEQDGVYEFTKPQVRKAVKKYLAQLQFEHTWGGGDSLDRERVYEFLINPNLEEIKNPRFLDGGMNNLTIQNVSFADGGGVGNMSEWSVSITSEDGDTYDWDGFAKNEDEALYKAEQEAGFESVESGITEITDAEGNKIEYAKGGGVASKSSFRANNSPLLEYANFKDGSHINLLRFNPLKRDGTQYKSGYKFVVSVQEFKKEQQILSFKTLEKAKEKFDTLVETAKSYKELLKQGKTNNYANGGSLPFMTDPNFGNFQNTGAFEDGGETDGYTLNHNVEFTTSDDDSYLRGNIGGDMMDLIEVENIGDNTYSAIAKSYSVAFEGLKGQELEDEVYNQINEMFATNDDIEVDLESVQIVGKFELGGAFMMTDLAGHTGGSDGLGNPTPLSGVSGTYYTGLVGETGAMSSGELFAVGGAVGDNVLGLKKGDIYKVIDTQHTAGNDIYTFIDYIDKDDKIALKSIPFPPNPKKKNDFIYVFDVSSDGIKVLNDEEIGQVISRKYKNFVQNNYEVGGELFAKGGSVDKNFDLTEYHKYATWEGLNLKDAKKRVDYYREMFNDDKKTKLVLIKKSELTYELWTNIKFGENGERVYEAGGAMAQNQQVINDASQSYVNYYLNDGGGVFKDGGAIKNQYEGRTPEDVWNKLTIEQREHFLHDHIYEINRFDLKKQKKLTLADIEKAESSDWLMLDFAIKETFKTHIRMGQYAYGGKTKSRPSMRELYIENIAYLTNTRELGVDAFAKEHNLTDSELSNLMTGLGRKMISQSDFITALVGNKNNPKQKEVVAFAKSDKAYKMSDGGFTPDDSDGTQFMSGVYANGGGIRSKEELKKIFSEKEAIVKNLTPKQIAEMWNKNSFGVKEGISKPITIEEAKRPSMKIYLENLLIENELTEEEQAKYFAKGGFVGTVEFNVGDTVWQKDEKRYATVMNNYGDPINGDYGEVRLDTTGNTLIFTSDKDYNTTGYNLIKVGEKGDTGKFTPEVLAEMKESANRLIESRRQGKDKEGVKGYQEVYKRLLDGEFDSMTGAKATAPKKTKKQLREDYLENVANETSEVWDKIGASSGGQIREDQKLLKAYADGTEEVMQKMGVKKGTFDRADYDYYTENNAHLFNDFLVFNGYYNSDMTKSEKEWRLKAFDEDIKQYGKSKYISNPDVITVSVKTSSSSTAPNKKGSSDYTYVPNKDVKELSVVVKGELKKLMGTDILDGVYVKNSAKSTAKVDANAVYAKMLKDAKEAKSGKTKRFDASEIKMLNLEMVQKLVEAGYTEQQIRNVIFGYTFDNDVLAEGEFDTQSGIFGYEESYVPKKIDSLVEAKKKNEFVLGIEYPNFDWKSTIKKYKIDSKPKELSYKKNFSDGAYYEYFYQVFVGEKIAFGHNIGYKRFDKNGKLEDDFIEKGKVITDLNKLTDWQKEREYKPGFNGGYWYVVTSKIETIDDLLKTLLSQKDGYCKELDFYADSFSDTLKENKIAFADGGTIGSGKNGYVAFYKGKRIEVYADTMYEAQKTASQHFKARKDYDVNVVLAEVDGKPYINSTMFADGGQMEVNDINSELEDFDLDNLDPFETMQYENYSKSMSKVDALQVLINTVEGDYSQLSPELAELAEMQISQEQWDESSREMYGYAKGGKLDSGVYRVGKPTKISSILYEQKIAEIFDNGDISTASDYGRKLSDFKSQKYPIITKERLDAQYKMANGGGFANDPFYKAFMEKRDKLYAQLKSRVVRAVGIDEAIEFFDYDYSSIAPYKFIERAVQSNLIALDEINKELVESAMDEAREIDNDEDLEEIGSSDFTYYLQHVLDGAGFKVGFVNDRLQRLNEDGSVKEIENNYADGGFMNDVYADGGDLSGVDLNFDFETEGDAELEYPQEVEKIKLLRELVNFDEVRGAVDYGKTKDNTDLQFYKKGKLVMTVKGHYDVDAEILDTEIDILGIKHRINYHPYDSMGGLDYSALKRELNKANFANGGMFDDNDGFMKADNNNNYRYPEMEVYVETIDEPIDLTSNVSSRSNKVVIVPIDENIDLNDDNRVRARMGFEPKNRTPEKMMMVNPRMIVNNLPTPISNTHKND